MDLDQPQPEAENASKTRPEEVVNEEEDDDDDDDDDDEAEEKQRQTTVSELEAQVLPCMRSLACCSRLPP